MVVILALNVVQSEDERKPLTLAVEVGCENVHVPEEDAIRMFEGPDVAKLPVNQSVRSADKSPPPVSPKPVLIAREEDTAEIPRENAPVVLL